MASVLSCASAVASARCTHSMALTDHRPAPRRHVRASVDPSPPQFSTLLATKLFAGRCTDLNVQRSNHAFRRFQALTACAVSEQYLELKSLGLGPTSADALVQVLSDPTAPQLAVLELEGNALGDKGALAIAELLCRPGGSSLVWLGLGSNGIGILGGIGLASALSNNRSLTAIDLSSQSGFRCRNMMGRKASAALISATSAKTNEMHLVPSWRTAPEVGAYVAAENIGQQGASAKGGEKPAGTAQPDAALQAKTVPKPAPNTPSGAVQSRQIPPEKRPWATSEPLAPPQPPPSSPPSSPSRAANSTMVSKSLPLQRLTGALLEAAAYPGEFPDDPNFFEPVPVALIALCSALEANPLLAIVRLGGNALGTAGASLLAERLPFARGLSELSLPNNDFTSAGVEVLAAAVAGSESLSVLDLAANAVGDRGALALAEALIATPGPRMPTPEEVVASGGEDVQHLLLRGLSSLNLSANGIGPKGGAAIGRCLSRRPALHTLRLQRNMLGDEVSSLALHATPCRPTHCGAS